MQTQQAPQPTPSPERPVGVGAPSQNVQSLTGTDGGSGTTSPAPSGSLLQVFLPITAVQVTVSQSSQGASYIPNSGNPSTQQAYQFALDGYPGTITFSYTDTTTSKATTYVVNIQGQYGQFPQSPSKPIINFPVGPIYKGGGAPIVSLPPLGPVYKGGSGGSGGSGAGAGSGGSGAGAGSGGSGAGAGSGGSGAGAGSGGSGGSGSSSMSSGTVAAIVVGVLAVAAAGGYAYYRHTHPAHAAARR